MSRTWISRSADATSSSVARNAAINSVGTSADSASSTTVTPSYGGPTGLVFGDDFESGTLSAWSNAQGNGLPSVGAPGAHAGSAGLRLANTVGQYSLVQRTFSTDLVDSTTRFWVRVNAAAGIQTTS